MLDTLDFTTESDFLSPSEVEEMEAVTAGEFHEGYLADLAAFEGMGR